MQQTLLLHFLSVLFIIQDGVLAKDPTASIRYESGNEGILPNDQESFKDDGVLVLNPTNNLQNENEAAITQYREYLDNSIGKILSDLPNTHKKKRRHALREVLEVLTGVSLSVSPLGESLGKITGQQAELVSKLKHQEEWKFWAAAKVQKVGQSTEGLRTAEAVSITEEFNNRYVLRLRNCVGQFLWAQIRFNLDLKKSIDGLQMPTNQVIEATERCPSVKPKKCRKGVRRATVGLQNAPQNLHNLWIESNQLEDIQKQSNQCLDKTLKEYFEERSEIERQLEDIIKEYHASETPTGK
ncbi:uncharacterized protein LOC119561114 [Drosophila subpulchrella]|uniref:uncharacterized protein LOC119561114 n=1 Tax=Drosophila subpulchrella TaxID=1486046 RepID=UPI0018A15D2B|nr:uncharacterized protein LOC119561114 [Drosophila subpulchrella]